MSKITKTGPAKAAPKSQPGKWDRPGLSDSNTKSGPGRKAHASAEPNAPRTAIAPATLKKLHANVGRNWPFDYSRRVWRDGEPVHIVKPVRAARLAAERAKVPA